MCMCIRVFDELIMWAFNGYKSVNFRRVNSRQSGSNACAEKSPAFKMAVFFFPRVVSLDFISALKKTRLSLINVNEKSSI